MGSQIIILLVATILFSLSGHDKVECFQLHLKPMGSSNKISRPSCYQSRPRTVQLHQSSVLQGALTLTRRLARGTKYSVTTVLFAKSIKSKLFVITHALFVVLFLASVNSIIRRAPSLLRTYSRKLSKGSTFVSDALPVRERYAVMGKLMRKWIEQFISLKTRISAQMTVSAIEYSTIFFCQISRLRAACKEHLIDAQGSGDGKVSMKGSEWVKALSRQGNEISWRNAYSSYNGAQEETAIGRDLYERLKGGQFMTPALKYAPVSVPLMLSSRSQAEGPLMVMQVSTSVLSRPKIATPAPVDSSSDMHSSDLFPLAYGDGYGRSGQLNIDDDDDDDHDEDNDSNTDRELVTSQSSPVVDTVFDDAPSSLEREEGGKGEEVAANVDDSDKSMLEGAPLPVSCFTPPHDPVSALSSAPASPTSSPFRSSPQSPLSLVDELELQLVALRAQALQGEEEVQRLVALISAEEDEREEEAWIEDLVGLESKAEDPAEGDYQHSTHVSQSIHASEAEEALQTLSTARELEEAKLMELTQKVRMQEEKLRQYSSQSERFARERSYAAGSADDSHSSGSSSSSSSNGSSSGSSSSSSSSGDGAAAVGEKKKYGRRNRSTAARSVRQGGSWPTSDGSEEGETSGAMAAAMALKAQKWVTSAVTTAFNPVEGTGGTGGEEGVSDSSRCVSPEQQAEEEKELMRLEAVEAVEEIEATLNAISKEAFACFAKYVSERI